MAHRIGARCRTIAESTARSSIDWLLRELPRHDALYRFVDEIVEYLVRHPDVERLVHEQSATLLGDAVDEVRTGAARADVVVDRMVRSVRGRLRRRR